MGWFSKTLCILLLMTNPFLQTVSRAEIASSIPHEYLRGEILDALSPEFMYRLNFFTDVQQYTYDNDWIATIGNFNEYIGEETYVLTEGTFCGAIDAPRSGTVQLQCGESVGAIATEPSICYYELIVTDPLLCISPSPPPPSRAAPERRAGTRPAPASRPRSTSAG